MLMSGRGPAPPAAAGAAPRCPCARAPAAPPASLSPCPCWPAHGPKAGLGADLFLPNSRCLRQRGPSHARSASSCASSTSAIMPMASCALHGGGWQRTKFVQKIRCQSAAQPNHARSAFSCASSISVSMPTLACAWQGGGWQVRVWYNMQDTATEPSRQVSAPAHCQQVTPHTTGALLPAAKQEEGAHAHLREVLLHLLPQLHGGGQRPRLAVARHLCRCLGCARLRRRLRAAGGRFYLHDEVLRVLRDAMKTHGRTRLEVPEAACAACSSHAACRILTCHTAKAEARRVGGETGRP